MKSEEIVPRKTPKNITNEKPKIDGPPSSTRHRSTISVIPDVRSVRLKVLLRAMFTISENLFLWYSARSSRTRQT